MAALVVAVVVAVAINRFLAMPFGKVEVLVCCGGDVGDLSEGVDA